MKKISFVLLLVLTIALEMGVFFYFTGRIQNVGQNPVTVNDCMYSITDNFGNEKAYLDTLDYVILDDKETVIYRTREGLSDSINKAVKNNDLIMDLMVDGRCAGKVIFDNTVDEQIREYKKNMLTVLAVIVLVQILVIVSYYLYIAKRVLEPFKKMNSFAVRVANGNLDIPLMVDKKHVFGEFTEAFDLMRSELKKARLAEKKANDDKKEMIAKLSHDIKTPVASIKATSEFGHELSKEERTKEMFNQINVKSDQITTLVDNLFNSSVNDITEIAVNPGSYPSDLVVSLIKNSDYLDKTDGIKLPECMVYIDKLRLQQAFDNVFMNSYKYAGTKMKVEGAENEEYLIIKISDYGEGVKEEELPLLKEKYKRGSNITEKDGAGLGLYLTDYFIEKMGGKMSLANADSGFVVTLCLRKI